MKGILIILDGLGDLPLEKFSNKTPLEIAETPNLDFFAERGEMGCMYPVKPNFIPESDEAIVSIFGNELIQSTRGQLEARGIGLKLTRGDLAFRVNFGTIDSIETGNILDRRGGRTLTIGEAEALSKAINKIKLPCEFIFKPTIGHRAVFVLKGGFSDNVTGNDLTYLKGTIVGSNKISPFKALDDEDNTQYTVNILNEFMVKAYNVLNTHPINEMRRKKGLLPANFLLMRGPGIDPPKLRFYRKWLAIAYMPLEIGFSKISGMDVFSFDYPKLKNFDSYENLKEGLKKACLFSIKILKSKFKNYEYAYVHIKETDLPGHDNKPIEKKEMIEFIDKTFFKFLREFAPLNKINIVITGDHSTPCKLKNHSADPVPVLFYRGGSPKIKEKINSNKEKNEENQKKTKKFCEKNAKEGNLGSFLGKDLFEKVNFLY
ncbi:MAG: alkaline phosphatase family protein [Candidatus Pacearchaeota archaeon]